MTIVVSPRLAKSIATVTVSPAVTFNEWWSTATDRIALGGATVAAPIQNAAATRQTTMRRMTAPLRVGITFLPSVRPHLLVVVLRRHLGSVREAAEEGRVCFEHEA